MKRIERVEKELREVLEIQVKFLARAFEDREGDSDKLDRPWMYLDELKKFEDVSWAREQYIRMVAEVSLGVISKLDALKSLLEAQAKYHEHPKPGYRKA